MNKRRWNSDIQKSQETASHRHHNLKGVGWFLPNPAGAELLPRPAFAVRDPTRDGLEDPTLLMNAGGTPATLVAGDRFELSIF